MKKLFKFATLGTVLLVSMFFAGCKSYVDTLTVAGYVYELSELHFSGPSQPGQPNNDLDPISISPSIPNSTITFNSNGTAFTWVIGTETLSGSYQINQGNQTIELNTGSKTYVFKYTGKAKELKAELNDMGTNYPEGINSPYRVVYKIKGKL